MLVDCHTYNLKISFYCSQFQSQFLPLVSGMIAPQPYNYASQKSCKPSHCLYLLDLLIPSITKSYGIAQHLLKFSILSFLLKTGSQVVHASLEFTVQLNALLLLSPKCWVYRRETPCLTYVVLMYFHLHHYH